MGVNRFQREEEEDIDILVVDNEAVLKSQVRRGFGTRARRVGMAAACDRAIVKRLEDNRGIGADQATCSRRPSTAARARASVGEISMALEGVYGRHQAEVRSISGVYSAHVRGRFRVNSCIKLTRPDRRGIRRTRGQAVRGSWL